MIIKQVILFILCIYVTPLSKRYAHVDLLLSTGDNLLVFTALKGNKSEVIHQLLKGLERDFLLKEFSKVDNDESPSDRQTLGTHLERGESTNNNFELNLETPSNAKHSESKEQNLSPNRGDNVQDVRNVNVTKAEVANASSSVSLDKHSQLDYGRRLSENSSTTLNKGISKTNITIKSLVMTELVTTVLSNVTGAALNAMVKTSGVAKQTSFLTPTMPLTQHIIDSIAQNMEVRFDILQSFNIAVITLINKGSASIRRNLWAIYVCIATGLELGHLVHREDGYVLPDKKSIKLTHLGGCSFKIEPTKDFKAIPPGKSIEIMVHIGLTESRSDLAPRWYVAADGLEPRIIPNTASEALDFVFFPPKRRKSWDSFVNCDAADLGSAPLLVIPTPSEVVGFNATNKLSVDGNWIVLGEPGLEGETSFLAGNYNIWFSCKRNFRKFSGEDEVSSHGAGA